MRAADLSWQHWILFKWALIKTNGAIMQMRGCRDRFTFSGPLAHSLMLRTLWIRKVVHLPVSANHAALPTCCFHSSSADAFHFISVAFVIITPAFKRAEYFYTHKQKKKKHVFSLKISTGSSLAGLIMGTTETTAASREAGNCYKLFVQSTMYLFNTQFRWLITLLWAQKHWMEMLIMNWVYASTRPFSAAR